MSDQLTVATLTVVRPYALTTDDVVRALDTDTAGLSSQAASDRLGAVGRNLLPEPKRKPAIVQFLSHFNDTLIYILLGAAAVKAIMADWLDFWVIVAVAVINAVIGFLQEGRAEKALAGIRGMMSADIDYARTEAVAMRALGQLAYLFNCRFLSRSSLTADVLRGNPVVWWSALALIALQLVYTYAPFMHDLFGSRPLAIWSWILPIVLSVVIFLAVEGLKVIRRRGTRFTGGS